MDINVIAIYIIPEMVLIVVLSLRKLLFEKFFLHRLTYISISIEVINLIINGLLT